ncbi:type VI secretion system-associated protein TagF [Xanthomonas sp. WHRI 1810A]|uniref:type VI secretion system-associated protein TagF n=1 Tax=Xanthomonas sp. WHRI 1810A TaxID=3161565 RepID=UPI0032E8C16C
MSLPGFYGKIASRGDFVTRGLAAGFTQPWDSWLASGMRTSQQQLGECWLDAYLVSPLWRFALAAGVCGPDATVGVLMPSIDRVGRYFPLTVAQTLEPEQSVAGLEGAADDWFSSVETLMLSTLNQHVGFDTFVAGLTKLRQLIVKTCEPVVFEGASLWWGKDEEGNAQAVKRCQGLPDPRHFGSYLLGHGAEV